MKVLLVNNFFTNTGGAENATYRTGSILKENGHEVFYFATDKKPFYEENYPYSRYFPKYIDFSNLSKIKLCKFIFNPFYFYNFEAEKKLDSYLKKIKPDVVHMNCISYYLSPSVLRACNKLNIPTVMTLHDSCLMCPAGSLMKKSESYCKEEYCISGNPLKCLLYRCNDKSLFKSFVSVSEFIFRKPHKLYDSVYAYICPSQTIKDLALRGGIDSNKLFLIKNFIGDHYLKTKPVYENKGYFLYAGRLAKEKGINFIIDAAAKIPKEIEIHIVGTGPEEEELKKMAEDLNLSNVKFLGFKSGEALEEEFKNCIATIIPSNYLEAFGLTIIESFSYGKPVIGSNIGGIAEIIDNRHDGIIFEPRNIDQLAKEITGLYYDNNLVKTMGKNGKTKVNSHYNSQIHYFKLTKLYEEAISQSVKV